eukprot:scaffold121554_cov37-Prasinocladus_malaysianus.AAC.1
MSGRELPETNPMPLTNNGHDDSGYAKNTKRVNDAIVGMLARIADPEQLDGEPMLFQLSVLRVFHQVNSKIATALDFILIV